MYIAAQTVGAILAAMLILMIASRPEGFALTQNNLALNRYGKLSPGKYSLMTALTTDIVMTAVFLFIILGFTDKRGTAVARLLAIGLSLTMIHRFQIPATNTSVNHARSRGFETPAS
jgi:aquaporin Z